MCLRIKFLMRSSINLWFMKLLQKYIFRSQQNNWSHKIYFCRSQQISESHKVMSAEFNKLMDPFNFFLLEATKRWIQWIYFCSDQQTVDSVIHFYWSQQTDKFISGVTTVFPRGQLWCFHITIKIHLIQKRFRRHF